MTEDAQNTKNGQIAAALDALSFEEALAELEGLVRRLEDGKAGLEDSIAAYERGALLKKHCEKKLRDAQERIEQITGSDGNLSLSPLAP